MSDIRELKTKTTGFEHSITVLVQDVATKQAKNDKPYLMVAFRDATGEAKANVFAGPMFNVFGAMQGGDVAQVLLKVEFYQERFSPKILEARRISRAGDAGHQDRVAELEGGSPTRTMDKVRFAAALSRLPDDMRRVVEWLFANRVDRAQFESSPAATGMHHAYRGGLLEHTTHMCELAHRCHNLYPEVDIGLATAAIILHDMAKVFEYRQDGAKAKTLLGVSHGHIAMGFILANAACRDCEVTTVRRLELEHIILAHHGKLEFGSPVKPASATAVFVNMLDDLDAKMGMIQQCYRDLAPGIAVGDRHLGLETNPVRFADYKPEN